MTYWVCFSTVRCPRAPDIENGIKLAETSKEKVVKPGTLVVYGCNPGYKNFLKTSMYLVCTYYGTWSGETPFCGSELQSNSTNYAIHCTSPTLSQSLWYSTTTEKSKRYQQTMVKAYKLTVSWSPGFHLTQTALGPIMGTKSIVVPGGQLTGQHIRSKFRS